MQPLRFGVTFDYRCPFAANAHDMLVEALQGGADWDVTFSPFSLGQTHVAEGETDIWDEPDKDSGIVALQAGVIVRDHHPEKFLAAHHGLFRARHVEARLLRAPAVVHAVLTEVGVDADAVFDKMGTGDALATIRKEHEAAVDELGVWGVPTFMVGSDAVFVRLMHNSGGDAAAATTAIERIVSLAVGWPDLNEFKHARLPH